MVDVMSSQIKEKTAKNIDFGAESSIQYFMSDMPEGLEKKWPFDFSEEGYETSYIAAVTGCKQAGFIKTIQVQAEIKNEDSRYVIAVDFDYDFERLDIELESLYKEKGRGNSKFSMQLIEKLKSFALEHDNLMASDGNNLSVVKVHAKSGYHKKSEKNLWGGYVWANYGFDFDKRLGNEQISNMRKAFKSFCAEKGLAIDDKDLKRFSRPCHFAAFDCGMKIESEKGKVTHIGKEFMLRQSWRGTWSSSDVGLVQDKYAKEYNNHDLPLALRRKNAVMILGTNYVKMLKKYAKQTKNEIELAKDKVSFVQKLKMARMQLSKVMRR